LDRLKLIYKQENLYFYLAFPKKTTIIKSIKNGKRNNLYSRFYNNIWYYYFCCFYFNRKNLVKRKLKKAVGLKIYNFKNGDIAKVAGKVELVGEPLIAPLSGRKCAHYQVLVEELVSTGKSSHWHTLIKDEKVVKFVIRDGRYSAFVNYGEIKSYLVEDRLYKSGFRHDATPELEQYLYNHGRKSVGILGLNKTIRYREGILEEGESIAVAGRGEWKNASDLQLPDSYYKVLFIDSTGDDPVYLTDDPKTVKNTYPEMFS